MILVQCNVFSLIYPNLYYKPIKIKLKILFIMKSVVWLHFHTMTYIKSHYEKNKLLLEDKLRPCMQTVRRSLGKTCQLRCSASVSSVSKWSSNSNVYEL